MMRDWGELVRLPDQELARLDIAAVNLGCAEGSPGCDTLDPDKCLRTIDDMAARCGAFTDRVMPMFRRGECDYPESVPKFRIQAMITYIQRDIGVRYHPERVADDSVFQAVDHFLHGIFVGGGGTCGNMPVLYTAVGRRLGYPIRLVGANAHLFCRWDARPDGECFNLEGAGTGVSFFPDEHYRTGRYAMPPGAAEAFGYLESQSPRRELASFLSERAYCWWDAENYSEASLAFAWANELAPGRKGPGSGGYSNLMGQVLQAWHKALQSRLPSRLFPKLDIGLPPWRFAELPREMERERICQQLLQTCWTTRATNGNGGVRCGRPRRPGRPGCQRCSGSTAKQDQPARRAGKSSDKEWAMYSPTLGRWLQNDPIGFQAGDQNLYRFVGNNR